MTLIDAHKHILGWQIAFSLKFLSIKCDALHIGYKWSAPSAGP